jgi:hypothetical protein
VNRAQRRHPAKYGPRRQLPPGTVVTWGKQRMEKFVADVNDAEGRKALRARGLFVPEAPIERKTKEMQSLQQLQQPRTPGGLLLPATGARTTAAATAPLLPTVGIESPTGR